MNAPQRLYILTVSLVVSSLTFAMFASAADPVAVTDSATAPPPAQAVYDKMCKSCHGPDGRGNPQKAATLKIDARKLDLARDEVKDVARDEKKRILLEGKEKMPAYGKKLKPADVEPVLDYALKLVEKNGGAKK